MQYLIDILLVALGVLFIVKAAQKGFVASALHFAFSLLGTVAAWVLAAAFCEQIYTRFFQPAMLSYLSDTLLANVENQLQTDWNALLSAIPASLLSLAEQIGLDLSMDFSGVITAEQLENAFFGPVAVFIIKCVLFIVLSILLGIILRFVARIVNRLVKRSFLAGVNTALGALFGTLQAVLVLFIAALCLTAVACATPESSIAVAISNSKICSLAVEILHMI